MLVGKTLRFSTQLRSIKIIRKLMIENCILQIVSAHLVLFLCLHSKLVHLSQIVKCKVKPRKIRPQCYLRINLCVKMPFPSKLDNWFGFIAKLSPECICYSQHQMSWYSDLHQRHNFHRRERRQQTFYSHSMKLVINMIDQLKSP